MYNGATSFLFLKFDFLVVLRVSAPYFLAHSLALFSLPIGIATAVTSIFLHVRVAVKTLK